MRINLNFEYDKLNLKEITILIPKYHPNMVSFLTPILGLYGINVKEFINDFEIKTKFISFDVIVPTTVKISKIKTFEIFLRTPYVMSLLSNLEGFSLNKPNLNVLSIYKISLIKAIFRNNFLLNLHKNIYKSLRKYISLIIKTNNYLSINKPFFNYFLNPQALNVLKKNISYFILLKELINLRFGFFLVFNNSSASYINYLKTALSIRKLSFKKLNTKLVNSLINRKIIMGKIFYLSSKNWSSVHNFVREVISKQFLSNLFPVFFRFNSNLLNMVFLKVFFSNFNFLAPTLKTCLLKILYHRLFLFTLLTSKMNNRLISILNFKQNII